MFGQNLSNFEVILIDSGSKDRTLQIASEFPLRIISIDEEDFHHARTRNLGVSLSKGKYIVFLTADAYPINAAWLNELLEPFKNEQIAATYSRQIPLNKTNPIERAFLELTYPRDNRKIVLKEVLEGDPSNFVLLSDVSSAYRKEVVEFNEAIKFCEDQEIALRLLEAGHGVAYVPTSLVCHAHNYSIASLLKRYYFVGKSAAEFLGKGFDPFQSLRYAVRLFSSSFAYVIRNSGTKKKTYWFFYSIFYNSLKILAFGLGHMLAGIH